MKKIIIFLVCIFYTTLTFAQAPSGLNRGLIFTEQDSVMGNNKGYASPIVLDPNQDGWITDRTNPVLYLGTTFYPFTTNIGDEQPEFEIAYLSAWQLMREPIADLQTGTGCGQTEIVDHPNQEYAAGYFFLDETSPGGPYLLFRMRIAKNATGAFGFSFFLDTDLKFGNYGTNADPNFTSGNPGFEYEILYSTGNSGGVEVRWVDGVAAANQQTILKSYAQETRNIRSNAVSTNCPAGITPVFYDFYINLADLNLTSGSKPANAPVITKTTPFRLSAATASSGGSGLGGSASDIMGVDDASFSDDSLFLLTVLSQPPSNFESGDLTDTDGDGYIDSEDVDDDNDGILDTDEGGNNEDTDGDGIPNRIDLDSDNDGISDVIEAGGSDPDNDGHPGEGNATNSDANGLPINLSGTAISPANNDGDALANPYDIDADNDGIVDVIEAQSTNGYVAPLHTDADGDGIDDAFDPDYSGNANALGSFIGILSNVDGDSEPDYVDLNSDNDASTDQAESGFTADASGLDSDNDGLLDDYDTDGSGTTNNGKSNNGGQTPASFTNTSGKGDRDWREAPGDIIWDGTQWSGGSGISGEPSGDEAGKKVRIMPGNEAPMESAKIPDLIIEPNAILGVNGCLEVTGSTTNNGLLKLVATSDAAGDYGQYLGDALENVECQMFFDNGWHNVGFPVAITASELAKQNNTIIYHGNDTIVDTLNVLFSNNDSTQNLRWYDSFTSGGKEIGFFVDNGGGPTYTTHVYGTWNLVSDGSAKYAGVPDEDLTSKGYSFYYDEYYRAEDRVIKAVGTTNDQEKVFATSNNFGGFNLIPNLYPVSISTDLIWNHASKGYKNIADLDKVLFMWDPADNYESPIVGDYSNGKYLAFDPETGVEIHADVNGKADKLIAPFQGFYIRRTSASTVRRKDVDGTVLYATGDTVSIGDTIDPAVATHSFVDVNMSPEFRSSCASTKHFKTNNLIDVILLSVKDKANSEMSSACEIAFAPHYSNKIDAGYDINVIGSNSSTAPQLFSIIDQNALVINKMGTPLKVTTVDIGFNSTLNGKTYTIDMNIAPYGWDIYLEDKLNGTWTDVTKDSYTFTNNTAFATERFVLHFSMKKGEVKNYSLPQVTTFSNEEGIVLAFNNINSPKADVMVTNINGQILYTKQNVSTSENLIIPVNQRGTNVYFVTVISSQFTLTNKIVR